MTVGADLWSFGPLPAKTDETVKAVAMIEYFIVVYEICK